MVVILNIETATEVCSVSIGIDGQMKTLAETCEKASHAKMITIMIEDVVQRADITFKDIDAVAISKGPGSYTSLRIGTSVAKGLCYALDIPLISISTLQSIAWAATEKSPENSLIVPMIDARRMDVYTGIFDYQNNPVTEISFKSIAENTYISYFASERHLIFVGNGSEKCRQIIDSPFASFGLERCSARNMVQLSQHSYEAQQFEDVAYFVPFYLKPPNITQSKRTPLKER